MPKEKAENRNVDKPAPFIVGHVVFCEEARQELDGGMSIIGAQIGSIGVTSFPSVLNLRMVAPIEWNLTDKETVLVVSVLVKNKEIFRGALALPAVDQLVYGPIITPRMALKVAEETEFEVKMGPKGFPLNTVATMPIVLIKRDDDLEKSVANLKYKPKINARKGRAKVPISRKSGSKVEETSKRQRKIS